jgi:hypothetical protein
MGSVALAPGGIATPASPAIIDQRRSISSCAGRTPIGRRGLPT